MRIMGRARGNDERLRILTYWWMLELFSPQQVPALTRRATRPSDRQVIAWRRGDPLPWETLAPPEPFNGARRVWRHTVYLGVYKLEATYEALGRVFGEDPDAYDKRPEGESACAGLLVDHDGRLVTASAVLSSALWAAGRTRDPGPSNPGWMVGFDEAAEEFVDSIDACEGARRDVDGREQPPPQDSDSLTELLKLSHLAAGVVGFDDLANDRVVIDSMAVSARRAVDGTDTDFLNSFYLDDLAAVRDHVARGDLGAGLTTYLTGDQSLPVSDRIDVVTHPGTVDAGTTIERLPQGRWPADPAHSLALSQQFAVNRALNDLGRSTGLMGVNGPPGTGKTTMLRDILAGNVVERARRLAALSRPSHAFTTLTHTWSDGEGHDRIVRQLKPELTGFEMVVASANNAAVENVTIEIPDENAIDAPWRGQIDYFGDIATEILRDVAASNAKPPTAWGLVAARLGKKKNRSAFYSAFWFDETDPKTTKPVENGVPRMQTRLRQWRDGTVPYTPWAQAREAFHSAEQRVDALMRHRAQAEDRLRELPRLAERERRLEEAMEQERQRLHQSQHDLSQHQPVQQQADSARAQAADSHDRHLAAQPGVLETLLSFGRAVREWTARLNDLARTLDDVQQHHQEVHDRGQRLRDAVQQAQARLSSCHHDVNRLRNQRARLQAQCAQDEERFGLAYPGSAWQGDQRELHAPWLDEELDTARSELFVAALQLHQAFLANAARDMLNGLRAAGEVVAGNYPRDLEPEKIRAAWQLFFLVVPLISTTFASASRMFSGVGSETIGWLLIDEAGQASPQYAAGAIWRAQRIVAVGDPLQLEPVVTLPEKARRNIASNYGLSSTWIPPRASVQTLADRVTQFGTLLDQGEDKVWVSAPLRVHRRCDDPMFTLCNQIAYNNLMVNGVQRDLDDPEERFGSPTAPLIAPSYWADEPARSPGSHLQPSQIERLEKALAYLANQGVPPSKVIAISPFRTVADRLRSLVPKYEGLQAGTIHTAQGREADVVILVLGGDPSKPGAPANWARTPNLVNVAASRAKRRLYVIGDRSFWAGHNYFTDLSNALRHSASFASSDPDRAAGSPRV